MNWNLLGHEWAVKLLREHITQGRMRQAYLFTGPQGVGRRTLALRFAQALNCQNPPSPGEACMTCRVCRQTASMQQPDLSVVQAEQEGGVLKVDQVRELQHNLALAPYEARYRVAILLRFEEANPNAANALLKTLEEPPSHVVLILTAESAERLLPTIVSRCEVLRLRSLPLEQASQGLQQLWEMPAEQAQLLAHISGGRPGYAMRLHQDPDRLERRQTWLTDLYQLIGDNRVERFRYAESLAKDKDSFRLALQVWISLWRDVLLCASGANVAPANLDQQGAIENLAGVHGLRAARQTVAALERTLFLLDHNTNTRLAAEVLMLNLPRSS